MSQHEKGREPVNTRLPEDLRDYERGDLDEPIIKGGQKVLGHIGACSLTPEGLKNINSEVFPAREGTGLSAVIPVDGDGSWVISFRDGNKRYVTRAQRDWFTNWNTPAKSRALSRSMGLRF